MTGLVNSPYVGWLEVDEVVLDAALLEVELAALDVWPVHGRH